MSVCLFTVKRAFCYHCSNPAIIVRQHDQGASMQYRCVMSYESEHKEINRSDVKIITDFVTGQGVTMSACHNRKKVTLKPNVQISFRSTILKWLAALKQNLIMFGQKKMSFVSLVVNDTATNIELACMFGTLWSESIKRWVIFKWAVLIGSLSGKGVDK